jgi:hypothetical protein
VSAVLIPPENDQDFLADVNAMVFSLDGVSQRGKMDSAPTTTRRGKGPGTLSILLSFGIVAAARWIVHLRTTDR